MGRSQSRIGPRLISEVCHEMQELPEPCHSERAASMFPITVSGAKDLLINTVCDFDMSVYENSRTIRCGDPITKIRSRLVRTQRQPGSECISNLLLLWRPRPD